MFFFESLRYHQKSMKIQQTINRATRFCESPELLEGLGPPNSKGSLRWETKGWHASKGNLREFAMGE